MFIEALFRFFEEIVLSVREMLGYKVDRLGKPGVGVEALYQTDVEVIADFRLDRRGRYVGKVRVKNEVWNARFEKRTLSLPDIGEKVRVLSSEGNMLVVSRIPHDN